MLKNLKVVKKYYTYVCTIFNISDRKYQTYRSTVCCMRANQMLLINESNQTFEGVFFFDFLRCIPFTITAYRYRTFKENTIKKVS